MVLSVGYSGDESTAGLAGVSFRQFINGQVSSHYCCFSRHLFVNLHRDYGFLASRLRECKLLEPN